MSLIKLDINNSIEYHRTISFPGTIPYYFFLRAKPTILSNFQLYSMLVPGQNNNDEGFNSFYCYNESTNVIWSKGQKILSNSGPNASIGISSKFSIVFQHSIGNNGQFGVHILDTLGQETFHKKFLDTTNIVGGSMVKYLFESTPNINSICQTNINENGNTYSTLLFSALNIQTQTFSGKLMKGAFRYFDSSLDSQGNIIIVGTIPNPSIAFNSQPVILKFDTQNNLIFAKIIEIEKFDTQEIQVKTFPNNDILVITSTVGPLPVVGIKISSDGSQVLWKKGYPYYEPKIDVNEKNQILFISERSYQQQSFVPNLSWAISDSLGQVADCSTFESCVSLRDTTYNFFTLGWKTMDLDTLETIEVNVEDIPFTFEPTCTDVPAPDAVFNLPDTLCLGDTAIATSSTNRFAQGRTWTITEPDGSITVQDSFNLQWIPASSGQHIVTQRIVFLGCPSTFSDTLTVLPPLTIDLGEDRTFCETPYELVVSASNRPLQTYEWIDGQTTARAYVLSGGAYSLTASDGYCVASDTVRLQSLAQIAPPPQLITEIDTLVCLTSLPIQWSPESPYANQFWLADSSQLSAPFTFSTAGDYAIQTSIEGCIVTDTLFLRTSDCLPNMYLPNAFSPNGSGLNTIWQAFGSGFTPIDIQVFDRWGGLMHRSNTGTWDGTSNGKPVAAGTYVMLYEFLNLKTGKKALVSLDVVVF